MKLRDSFFYLSKIVLNPVNDFFANMNWPLFSLCLVIAILGILVIIISISFGMSVKSEKNFHKQISYQNSTVRVFRIDSPRDTVRFFNLSDLRTVRSVTLKTFYSSFPLKEQGKIREWVNSILEGRPVPDYLQTDVYFSRDKRTVPSFLRVASSEPEKGIIHLESFLLRYDQYGPHSNGRGLSSESDFAEALKSNGSASGMTFCFSLVKKNPTALEASKATVLSPLLALRYKEALSTYVTGNEKLIQLSPSELVIANFDMVETAQGISFGLRVKQGVEKVILTQKRKTARLPYEIRIGMVANKDLLGDSDAILNEARNNAMQAMEKNNPLSCYTKNENNFSADEELHYRSEVDRIIFEKKLAYTYRPVYCVDKNKVVGYLSRVLPIGTSFSSIDELKNYAARAKDEKNLFAAIAKNLIPRFTSERSEKNQRLFFPIRLSERDNLISFFSHFPGIKDANIVFLFREAEIAATIDRAGMEPFLSLLSSIKKAGYEVALFLADKTLILDSSYYGAFDFFFVDFASGADTSLDTKIRSELHALVEKLLKFKKPIIGANLMSWNSIELVVGSGINFISSDVFAPYDTMFKPISSKNLAKIKAMADRR